MGKRAIIYIRTKHPVSVNVQLQHDACNEFCTFHELTIVGTLADVGDGYGLARPNLDELREMVRAGAVDVIVVQDFSRLSLDKSELVILAREAEAYHVNIFSVFEVVEGGDVTPLRVEVMTRER